MDNNKKQLIYQVLCEGLLYGLKGQVKVELETDRCYGWTDSPLIESLNAIVQLDEINLARETIFVSAAEDRGEDWADFLEDYQTMGEPFAIEEFKPYLRPMSSMTDEERRAYQSIDCGFNRSTCWLHTERLIDWLIQNHFDFRGLITEGLALPAPEGLYAL